MRTVAKVQPAMFNLLEVLLAYRLLCTFVPSVSVWSPTIINIPVLGLLYIVFISVIGFDEIGRIIQKFFPITLFFIVIYFLRTRSAGMVGAIMELLRLWVWPMGTMIIIKYGKVNIAKRLLLVFLAAVTITMFTTYFGNLMYPGVTRAMAHYTTDGLADLTKSYKRMNIGGFDFIYLLPFLPPFAIYIFRHVSKLWAKALAIAFVVLLALTVYVAQYTTALLLSAFSITLLFSPRKANTKQLILYYIGVTIAFVAGASTLSLVFAKLAENTEFGVYTERLGNISDLVSGNQIDAGDTANRIMLYKQSINSFFNNPLTGGSAGGHSIILDTIGRLGILGLIITIWAFSNLKKKSVEPYSYHQLYSYYLYMFMIQIIVGIMNPVLCLEVFLFVIPLFAISFQKK